MDIDQLIGQDFNDFYVKLKIDTSLKKKDFSLFGKMHPTFMFISFLILMFFLCYFNMMNTDSS